MNVIEMLAPLDGNCRCGEDLWGFIGITVHNTSNHSTGANAIAHANLLRNGWKYNYISWHYVIDETYAVRCVPENETAWCAGDGNGDGNRKTINIEICDNADGNITQATNNAVELCADILLRHGFTTAKGHLFQHHDWTGKDCPEDIRRGIPYDWNTFCNKVEEKMGGTPSPVGPDQVLHVGSKVIFNGVFKIDEIKLPDGKYPNGAVGCYSTCYGAPCGNDDYIPSGPLGLCNPDKDRVDYNGTLNVGDYFICDKIFTVKALELPTSYTPNGVAVLEADGVDFRVDCGPLYELRD